MRWRTIRRETGLVEHICEHGVGHPNAGSVQYMEYMTRLRESYDTFDPDDPWGGIGIPSEPYERSTWWIHGCDGCCTWSDFPGTAAGALKHAIARYVDEQPELLEQLKHDHFLLWWGVMAALNEARHLAEEQVHADLVA